jgi:putative transposase
VDGHWCYLYRAIDKEGNLVDVRLSDERDQAAAEALFNQCHEMTDILPDQITIDKEPALY